jgi:hypothetical protein
MAILSYDNNFNAVGIVAFPINTALAVPNAKVSVTDLIKNDLLILIQPQPQPYKDYAITWRLGLLSSGLSGGSIFRGPLPKYDLGTVVFTNGGAVVSEERWNWESQVFRNYLTQYSFSSENFPDIPSICEDMEPNPSQILGTVSSVVDDCADTFYICNDGDTVVSTLNAYISYQATFLGEYASSYLQTFTGTALFDLPIE